MEWFENREEYYDRKVIDCYPSVIAHEYKRLLDLLDSNQIYGACLQIKDVYEILLKFPILLIVADINKKEEKMDEENELILEMLVKPLSMGDWVEKAEQIIKKKLCNYEELFNILLDIKNIINKNQVVKWRNDHIGHGALGLDDDENLRKDIKNHLLLIKDYVTKLKDVYPKIKLFVNDEENKLNLLMGYKNARGIILTRDNEIYVRCSEKEYNVYPFIEIIKNEIYFFDSYIYRKEKTSLLNYIAGNKIDVKNKELINLYNICNNTKRVNKLSSSLVEDIYFESELNILNQIKKLNSFESPEYINKWIKSILGGESQKGLILLQAERGMGKTIFANSLDQLSLNKQKFSGGDDICIRAYHINDTYGSNVDNFEREINEIFTYDVGKCNQLKATKIFQVQNKQDVARILNYYRYIQELYYNKSKILFIIDGIDENVNHNEKIILDLVPEDNMIDDGVFILLTCRTDEEMKHNKLMVNKLVKMKFIEKKIFYRYDNKEYNEVLEKYITKEIKNSSINDAELKRILEYSDYRFLYLKTICQIIDSNNTTIDLCNIISDNFISSFLDILKSQYGEKYYNKALNIFIIIAIFYNPIGIKEVSYILGEGSPSFEVLPILHDIKGFLVVERDGDGNVYSVSNEEIKDTIIKKFDIQINLIISNYFNDILDTDFSGKYDEKSIEVLFSKNISYYMNIANIDEDKYINVDFVDKVFDLIMNFELDSNNYKAIKIFIELCSEIISLIIKLEDKFNKKNMTINNKVMIDIFLLRAMAYIYINKQILALKDFSVAKSILTSGIELDEKQEMQIAVCYSEMGKIYRYIDTDKSIENYDNAIESYYKLGKRDKKYKEDYLGNILNKANTYLRINPNEALKLYDLFIKEYESYDDNDDKFEKLSIAYVSNARAYRRINIQQKAIENIEMALECYKKINEHTRDEYFLAKLYVNRGSIYIHFYSKDNNFLDKVIKDSIESINILNMLVENGKIIDNTILINAYFNNGLGLFYKGRLEDALKIFKIVENLINQSLDKDDYVNYELIMFTYKYLIILNKEEILSYYKKLIQILEILKIMDNESVNKALEELYYMLFELINGKEFKIITQLAYLTENFIKSNIESDKSYKICEDIAAIYTLIAIAYFKENNKNNFDYFSNLAQKENLLLYTYLFDNFTK